MTSSGDNKSDGEWVIESVLSPDVSEPLTDPVIDVASFDRLSTVAAGSLLEPVCGSGVWIVAMVATRPHGTLELLCTRSDEAIAAMEWPDVRQALRETPPPDDADQAQVRADLAAAVRSRLAGALR